MDKDTCCDSEPVSKRWSEFRFAIPAALIVLAAFAALQKLGFVDIKPSGTLSVGTAFLVGLVASLSTCMAVIGGLVLSLSATFAGKGSRPQVLFHAGRLISFFALGGVLGSIGSAFAIGVRASAILGIVVGLVMLVLGLNLLDVFPWARKLQPSLPKSLSRFAVDATGLRSAFMPFIVGALTFFLPCGFTQSMQIYSLGTGSFLAGAATMLAFGLGTLPVLVAISVGSSRMRESAKSGTFLKTAGLVVIGFALFNMTNSFSVVFGTSEFLGSRYDPSVGAAIGSNVSTEGEKQVVLVSVRGGYSPRVTTAKAGVPTIFRMRSSGSFDCSSSVAIPSLSIWKNLAFSGDTDIEIGPQKAGTRLEAMCSMGMYRFYVDFI